ncbi:putative ORFan [Tupanvirus deep ocean]|uniref:ORFan n=2 Tax=Tupanvirus TaxID=2094720 RepID=A0AC62AA19_9VIRU|nr:putative ORFan [Tupanvirus deep ocean]QKU34626.1 putative ORFan [Tupanvirus deep ocean]
MRSGYYFVIGIIESYNYCFSHNICYKYSCVTNSMKYRVVSIRFTSLQEDNIEPFTFLIVKYYKLPKPETIVESVATIVRTTQYLFPSGR